MQLYLYGEWTATRTSLEGASLVSAVTGWPSPELVIPTWDQSLGIEFCAGPHFTFPLAAPLSPAQGADVGSALTAGAGSPGGSQRHGAER
ncbi:hypothetical protein CapIbe_010984 [Capra ibex]